MGKITLIVFSLLFLNFTIAQNNSEQLTDSRDGKQYKTVKIGDRIWMAENLAYKTKKGCWLYNNDEKNLTEYGYLYNQETAKQACPTGWELPTKLDFEALLMAQKGSWGDKYNALLEGGKSGFLALFGGYRNAYGYYYDIEKSAYFWSSTSRDETFGWDLYLRSLLKGAFIGSKDKGAAFSVRCIKKD